jgi:hypothetical protein
MTALNVFKMPTKASAKPDLNLPAPRIWAPQDLADFLRVSLSWIYKRTSDHAEDPIPKIPGIGRLKFDTENPKFQYWMRRQLGYIDSEAGDE